MFNFLKRKPKPIRIEVATYRTKPVSCGLESETHKALLAGFKRDTGRLPKGMAR